MDLAESCIHWDTFFTGEASRISVILSILSRVRDSLTVRATLYVEALGIDMIITMSDIDIDTKKART